MYCGRAVDKIEVDFFLVNVNNGQPKNLNYKILNDIDFPMANRSNKPQRKEDVTDYLSRNRGQRSLIRYSNFHFLVYLAKMFDIGTIFTIAQAIDVQKEIPNQIDDRIYADLKVKK